MKKTSFFLLITAIAMGGCVTAWAQATAQISGTVRDQSGAILPGVEVTVTQTNTGISRNIVTNETGSYVLPNLALGPYRLEAALPGFRTFAQTGIVLQVNSNAVINPVLEVGQVAETVEVQANAALVETRSVGIGAVIENERIMELPLNGRNAQELLLLAGGAVQVTPGGGRLVISSAGNLGFSIDYNLDGMRHLDPLNGGPITLPFPDALAEFKVETSGVSAQQTRGSQASAVTKSGTNEFHGDLFEFVRNDLFNARSYFATKGSTLKRNQFGGTAGGPIRKNKLFFFTGYQGTTTRQDPADTRAFVPTAAMLAGDFSAFASPTCNSGRQLTLRAPFVNNRVDPARFSPAAVKLASYLPKTDNPCGELTYGRKTVSDEAQIVSKVDYQQSDKHSLFGRIVWLRTTNPSPYEFTDKNILTASDGGTTYNFAPTIGSTYLISPQMVNAFRAGVTWYNNSTASPPYFEAADLGIKAYSYLPKVMQVEVTNGFSLPGNITHNRVALYQLSDDVSLTKGTHQIAFGAYVGESRSNLFANKVSMGVYTFNGQNTGHGLADFLTGTVSNFTQGNSNFFHARVKYFTPYIQDAWRMTSRLTVTYGMRWNPLFAMQDDRRPVPDVLNFDIERYKQGLRSTVFQNAPPGFLYPGDPGFNQKNNGASAAKPKADVFNTYWTDFSPRLGLAWDVEGNGRTSVRASYALTYVEYPTQFRRGTQIGQAPWGQTVRVLNPAGGFDDPWRGVPGGNPFPSSLSKDMQWVPFGDYMVSVADLTPTYSQGWNLSLQREVMPGTLVSANYLGTVIIHTNASQPLNNAIFVPGNGDTSGNCFLNGKATYYKVAPGAACSTLNNTQDRRALSFLNPAFKDEIGRFGQLTTGGTQNYHGLVFSVQRRPSRGVSMNANYTWSHCIADFVGRSNAGNSQNVDDTYQDPNNRYRDRANCESDQRHAFNLTGVAETPQFANTVLRLVGSGWKLSGIYKKMSYGNLNGANVQSGSRTVTLGAVGSGGDGTAGVDRALIDIASQRPDIVDPTHIYLDTTGRPGTVLVNAAAFSLPAVGTLGNAGRGIIHLPPTWQFDLALSRVFKLREAQSLEFRAEAYNLTNSFRHGNIDLNLSSSQFGKVRTALDPRILQFALKYAF